MSNLISKLEAHKERWEDCHRCEIGMFAHKHCAYDVVSQHLGRPTVLFVGEAPGTTEDWTGTPFTGEAGALLKEAIQQAGPTGLNVVLSNVVLCRPADVPGGDNRQPTAQEANNCADRLWELHEIVNPTVTVLVGKVAQEYGPTACGAECWPVEHPSFILRVGGRKSARYEDFVKRLKEVFDYARSS